jgi:transketolase
MDPATLTAFLAPFLPALLNLGAKAAAGVATKAGETAGTKLTENAFNKANAIWEKLFPKVEAKEDAKIAAEQVAAKPDSAARQAVLQEELESLLKENPDLAAAIAKIMEEDAPDGTSGTQIVQHVTGNQNQVIGQMTGGKVFGNVTGNITLNE